MDEEREIGWGDGELDTCCWGWEVEIRGEDETVQTVDFFLNESFLSCFEVVFLSPNNIDLNIILPHHHLQLLLLSQSQSIQLILIPNLLNSFLFSPHFLQSHLFSLPNQPLLHLLKLSLDSIINSLSLHHGRLTLLILFIHILYMPRTWYRTLFDLIPAFSRMFEPNLFQIMVLSLLMLNLLMQTEVSLFLFVKVLLLEL